MIALAGTARTAAAETVYLGVSLDLSRDWAWESRQMIAAINRALDRSLLKDGSDSPRMEVKLLDEAQDPDRARENARQFTGDPSVVAVVGLQTGSALEAAGSAYAEAGLPVISPSGSIPAVNPGPGWVYGLLYNHHQQALMLAGYLHHITEASRVVVVHADDTFGAGLADALAEVAPATGIEVTGRFSFPESGYEPAVLGDEFDRAMAEADALALFAFDDNAVAAVKDWRNRGWTGPILGGDGMAFESVAEAIGPDIGGVTVASPFAYELASLEALDLVRALRAEGVAAAAAWPSPYVPYAYDAAMLVASAVRAVGSDREAVRDFLAGIRGPESAIDGIGGRFHFAADGSAVRPLVFLDVEDGRLRPAFTQLSPVTRATVLNAIARGRGPDHVVDVGGSPFFRVQSVLAGLDVYRINNIDIREQRFDLEAFLWLRWAGELDVDQIGFINEIVSEESAREELVRQSMGDHTYALLKIKSRFVASYDVRDFPYDSQALAIDTAHLTKTADQLLLVTDAHRLSDDSLTSIYPAEWRFLSTDAFSGTYTVNSTFGLGDASDTDSRIPFSVYTTQINLQRILMPYIWTAFLPLAAMFAIAFLGFMIPQERYEARISLVTTALLSVLVFHLTQTSVLPPVGYLIRMDQYFVVAYVTMLTLLLVLTAFDRFSVSVWAEKRFAAVLVGAVVLANAVITAGWFPS